MSPLFMETGYDLSSPGSESAEESNTPGSEREGVRGKRGRKTEKNRDSARKSRRKQTERADELHEELQSLERSNSALKKDIAALKKDLNLYTTALECHKPCFLKDALSGSSTHLSVPPSAACESKQLSSSTPRPKTSTLASPSGSAPELFSSVSAPYAASFSAVPAPHSLFYEVPPSIIASRPPKNAPPVCTSLVFNPSSSLPAPTQTTFEQANIHKSLANASFSMNEFLMKQAPFRTPSSNVNSHLEAGKAVQGCPMNVHQLHTEQLSRNSTLPRSLLPHILQEPALKSLSEPPPASAFALKPRNSRQLTLNPASLLSQLTVPSPLYGPLTTSSSFDIPPPPPSLPPLGDPPRDFSLSELLEGNEWILSGTSHQCQGMPQREHMLF